MIPPYFDVLLELLERDDPATTAAFGRHVHWGYWPLPERADGTPEDYAEAAERLCEQVLQDAGIADGARVLDVGCGFGGTLDLLNRRHRDLQLTGVNIDARQLQRARQTLRPMHGNRLQLLEGDACQLPLPPAEQFDVILAVECIFHFPSRQRFFAEAASRLAAGGRLAISDFVPQPELARFLSDPQRNLLHDADARASYGRVDMLATEADYAALAAERQLTLVGCRDLTPNTLPTYDFLRSRVEAWEDAALARAFDRSTALLQGCSRKGMLRYQALTWQR